MIDINYRDNRPIYEQIKDSIRRLVVSGGIQPGDRLPSVRELAGQLAINPNTIQRAYRELESEGYIYSVAGKGSFAGVRSDIDTGRRDELIRELKKAAAELRYLGVTSDELKRIIDGGEQSSDRA